MGTNDDFWGLSEKNKAIVQINYSAQHLSQGPLLRIRTRWQLGDVRTSRLLGLAFLCSIPPHALGLSAAAKSTG